MYGRYFGWRIWTDKNRIIWNKGVICLKKNGLYGAYVVDTQKYVDCKYSKISYNDMDDVLCFSNDNMLYEAILL